jgi:FkbM family methyltransferase
MSDAPKDPFDLILRYLPGWSPGVIFDVGANVGQSAKAYARQFPQAQIHSFEPSPQTFQELCQTVVRFPKVVAHCLALGRTEATLGLTQGRRSAMNRLLPDGTELQDGAVEVPVRTGANLMQALGIEHIDLLKIDTEGHDLEVLHGFLPLLDRVDFIQVEAGMNPYNETHAPFVKLDGFLKDAGFHLSHIFDQKLEWKRGGQPILRRCNPLYVNGRLLDLQGIR